MRKWLAGGAQNREQRESGGQRGATRDEGRLRAQRQLEQPVERRRRQRELRRRGLVAATAPADTHRRRGQEVDRVEGGHPRAAPAGGLAGAAEHPARVAPLVAVHLVVSRPEPRVRGDRDHQHPARPSDPEQLAQAHDVVGRVLEHVQARDGVEAPVWVRDRLDRSLLDIAMPARARELDAERAELDARDAPVRRQLVERSTRACAGVEQPRAALDRQRVENRPHDATASAVPPVLVVQRDHGLELAAVHGRSVSYRCARAMSAIDIAETFVLLLAAALALTWLSRRLGIPYPVALVLGGIAIAFVPGIPQVRPDPDLVLLLFVAPLLFADAFFAPVAELARNARSVAVLASVLVGVTAGVVAVAAHFVLDVGWGPAFALGAALAATDAVAPVQVLGREGADPRLVAVIQGESLLNDGVAFALVKVASSAVVTGSFSLASAGGGLVLSILGGIAIGFSIAPVLVGAP